MPIVKGADIVIAGRRARPRTGREGSALALVRLALLRTLDFFLGKRKLNSEGKKRMGKKVKWMAAENAKAPLLEKRKSDHYYY